MFRSKWVVITLILVVGALFAGCSKRENNYDTVVLYASGKKEASEYNFCKVAEYYGLSFKRINVKRVSLDKRTFESRSLKTAFLSITTLEEYISREDLRILKNAINEGNINLIISVLPSPNIFSLHKQLNELTNEEILGVSLSSHLSSQIAFSKKFPEITKEFTGQKLIYSKGRQNYYINMKENSKSSDALIFSENQEPMFVRYKEGKGSIFIIGGSSCGSLKNTQMYEIYYSTESFSDLIPTMISIRYSNGKGCWHNNHNYANLTIDDPP